MELVIGVLIVLGVVLATVGIFLFLDNREQEKRKKEFETNYEKYTTPAYSRVPNQSQSYPRSSAPTYRTTSGSVVTSHYNIVHDRDDHYVDDVLVATDVALDLIHAAALAGLVQGSQPVECIPTDTTPCPDPSSDFGGGSSGGAGAGSSWDSGSQSDSHSSPSHSCSSSSSHSCSSSSSSSCSSSSSSSSCSSSSD